MFERLVSKVKNHSSRNLILKGLVEGKLLGTPGVP